MFDHVPDQRERWIKVRLFQTRLCVLINLKDIFISIVGASNVGACTKVMQLVVSKRCISLAWKIFVLSLCSTYRVGRLGGSQGRAEDLLAKITRGTASLILRSSDASRRPLLLMHLDL